MTDWNAGAAFGGTPEATDGTVAVTAAPEVQLTVEQKNELIKTWLGGKTQLVAAAGYELEAREKVSAALFPTPKKGTQRYVSPEGFGSIKLVHGWNYSLGDKEKIGSDGLKVEIRAQVEALLTSIEDLGERGRLIADRIVKWKPELSVSEYELLASSEDEVDIAAKTLIDELLTVKPASPQLSFEPPKVKK